MAKKFHWSYELAMKIVDAWIKKARIDDLRAADYESLIQSIANEIEAQRGAGASEGRRESPRRDERDDFQPRPWARRPYWGPMLSAGEPV